jgi:hypothetical protein
MLPNIANSKSENTDFEIFFTLMVNHTQDFQLHEKKLAPMEIKYLSERKKNILFSSLIQFNLSVQKRMKALANAIMNSTSGRDEFPNTLLFSSDQSAYSFKSFILNNLRISYEEILIQFFHEDFPLKTRK